MTSLPSLFISHGSPDTAIADTAARAFLEGYGASLPRPKAVVVASAHFEISGGTAVSHDIHPETIHDFGGFDPALYTLQYPAPGAPALADGIVAKLKAAGFNAAALDGRGYDHGTWVPLILLYPKADIPVVQVSVDPSQGPDYHLRLGRVLAGLRQEGILVIGSGSFTHNLREAFAALRTGRRQAAMPDWVASFVEWMNEHIDSGDEAGLVDYRRRAPNAALNHPTDEHLLPLYVAIGAAGPDWQASRIHDSHEFGALSMNAFSFDTRAAA